MVREYDFFQARRPDEGEFCEPFWTTAKTEEEMRMFTGIVATCLLDFFVSMGLVIGGSLLGGFSALITHHNPSSTMLTLAEELKIWALVAALGGTMDTLRLIHKGVFALSFMPMARQFVYLVAAFLGCQVGFIIIEWLVRGESNL